MKKSTLITTIAMIVVVVVALSTATYAWFTADSKTYATQTITTTGTSPITVTTNTVVLKTGTLTGAFGANVLLPHTIYSASEYTDAELGIRAGLWAPQGVLDVAPGDNDAVAPTVNKVAKFISGTQDPNSGTTFTASGELTEMSPDIVRVVSNVAQSHVYMNVYVAAASGTASEFAAQGVCFYLESNDGTSAALVAQTTYSYLQATMTKTTDYADNDSNDKISKDDTFAMSKFTAYNTTAYDATTNKNGAKAVKDSASANHRTTSTPAGTNFSLIAALDSDTKTNLGIASRNKYYVMTVDLGAFTAGQAINYALYTWLDGRYLTDAAGSAGISIAYSFSTVDEAQAILGAGA